jgi:hypothetical protein
MNAPREVLEAARRFAIVGELTGVERFGNGHINDSYRVVFQAGGTARSFLLQRVNTRVFSNPAALMENFERVEAHIARLLEGASDRERRMLTLIRSEDGRPYEGDGHGSCWRMMQFIEGSHAVERIASPEEAFAVAAAFGRFQRQLATLPPPRLRETIPDFHNTPKRFAALEEAIETDVANRAQAVRPEIAFAMARQGLSSMLLDAKLPERVTHNDTKSNNVLMDDETGEGLCVIDLDTVMPGLAPYDFGDMVRSMASSAPEDERDLSRVRVHLPVFEALAQGYLASTEDLLTREEKSLLVGSGKLITFENGLRFLSDYLNGDTYYKTTRAEQNLDRCRTQFRLVESIEQNEEALSRMVESLS